MCAGNVRYKMRKVSVATLSVLLKIKISSKFLKVFLCRMEAPGLYYKYCVELL